MAKPTANLRLFVAAYPPPEHVTAMLDAVRKIDLPPHRLTPAEQVHLTLLFVGDTPSNELDDTIESVRRAAAGLRAFPLHIHALITLPEQGHARLIAAEAQPHPTLLELQRRLATRLARNVRDRRQDRFRPHFTLARFRSPARLRLEHSLSLEPFDVRSVALMRSTLSSAGATHHPVATCELL